MLMCEAVAMGSGTLEKSDALRIQDGWREAVGGVAHKPPSPEFLASKGIGFRRERLGG
jgi:hypothetical protein